MELREKAAQLPLLPGVYLYKDQYGEVIYVGKAKNLRARVRSYFNDDRLAERKTGSLIADARDVEYILVDNNKEALALENNLIKQWKPRFNILLRDDKTFPYIKLTNEKYPRVYVTRRLIKDGSSYYGPYFPATWPTGWSILSIVTSRFHPAKWISRDRTRTRAWSITFIAAWDPAWKA
jgi:excinuclease ABC subunit C